MRHGKKINHLGRTSAHRHALLSNLASSLILNKRITTTVAKAKALRKYVEPLITKAKTDSTHSRRTVFAYLQNKESVKSLFGEVAGRTADRPGGYTRIIKLSGVRVGDAADMCLMELVDFNDIYKKDGTAKKAKTRRSGKGKKEETAATTEAVATEAKEEKPKKTAAKKTKKEE
ncbi:MAG: 50S ribosomal protein L17 [Bacteroidetes bacterium]|nr:50S ribosomal protein L17 [Bacteroidota bacterium]MBS1540782.1 50S ribosomal protein L17 [Bacteroidota bacterium]